MKARDLIQEFRYALKSATRTCCDELQRIAGVMEFVAAKRRQVVSCFSEKAARNRGLANAAQGGEATTASATPPRRGKRRSRKVPATTAATIPPPRKRRRPMTVPTSSPATPAPVPAEMPLHRKRRHPRRDDRLSSSNDAGGS